MLLAIEGERKKGRPSDEPVAFNLNEYNILKYRVQVKVKIKIVLQCRPNP